MSAKELDFFRLLQKPVEETPMERFLTMNSYDDANNVFARNEMKQIGIQLGDERSVEIRRQAAERIAKELLVSKSKK